MTTSSGRAAEYDRRYPESIDDFGQKVERMERIETRERRRNGGRRYHTVPGLPWKEQPAMPDGLNKYGESKVDKPEPTPTRVGPEGEKSTRETETTTETTEAKSTGSIHEVEPKEGN